MFDVSDARWLRSLVKGSIDLFFASKHGYIFTFHFEGGMSAFEADVSGSDVSRKIPHVSVECLQEVLIYLPPRGLNLDNSWSHMLVPKNMREGGKFHLQQGLYSIC